MPARGYLLCCIERTGSNLLGHALGATGLAGRPLEYFNPVEQDKPWMRKILGNSGLVDGLHKIVMAATTPNGVFGVKMHWFHFRYLALSILGEWQDADRKAMFDLVRSRLSDPRSERTGIESLWSQFFSRPVLSTAYEQIQSCVPDLRMIWLRRKNMVARAISHFRARRSGVWQRSVSENSALPPTAAPDFDFAEIHTLCCLGWLQEESWQQFFQMHSISPMCLVYEELVTDYEAALRRSLQFLDLDIDIGQAEIATPISVKQSDAISEEWEERYRKMAAEAGFLRFRSPSDFPGAGQDNIR